MLSIDAARRRRRLRRGGAVAACALLLGVAPGAEPSVPVRPPDHAGWSTRGRAILDPSGHRFVISGVTWHGFESSGHVAYGLDTRGYRQILRSVRRYGFNTVRIPFSNEMWEDDPVPAPASVRGCPDCRGARSRDVLASVLNAAGALGLHVVLDDHRSEAGSSAEENGLWYVAGEGGGYPERTWIRDWLQVQRWVHGRRGPGDPRDAVRVHPLAADGYPTVIGYELRNEPHTPVDAGYLDGATWGTGDGFAPTARPNPNPFAPACVRTSSCHDWRLAAERAADSLLGDAARHHWAFPLVVVDGISEYPTAGGTAAQGPYDLYWWGGQLRGVHGTSAANPGAPVLLNAGGNARKLGPPVRDRLVYSAHDFGPAEYPQAWFGNRTCYRPRCSASSLTDVWTWHWAYLDTRGVRPVGNTSPYLHAPVYVSEFGTGNTAGDLFSTGSGSQGQWFGDLVRFLRTSRMSWSYWALPGIDPYGLLRPRGDRLANPAKLFTFLCAIQQRPAEGPAATTSTAPSTAAVAAAPGSRRPGCGSTGALPLPR